MKDWHLHHGRLEEVEGLISWVLDCLKGEAIGDDLLAQEYLSPGSGCRLHST